jgi:hypothetical protein
LPPSIEDARTLITSEHVILIRVSTMGGWEEVIKTTSRFSRAALLDISLASARSGCDPGIDVRRRTNSQLIHPLLQQLSRAPRPRILNARPSFIVARFRKMCEPRPIDLFHHFHYSIVQLRRIRSSLWIPHPALFRQLPDPIVHHKIVFFVWLFGSNSASDDSLIEECRRDRAKWCLATVKLPR